MKITILGLFVLIAVASCDDVTTTGTGTSSLAPTTAAPEKPTERTTAPTQPTTVTPAPTTSTPKPSEPTTLSPPTAPAVYPSDDSKFPGSVSFSVNIADSNQTCLQAKLAVQFVLSISNATKFLKLEDASRADQSTCATVNETKIPLKLTFGGNNVTFVFMRDDQLTSGWLDSVHLEYRVDNVSDIQKFDIAEKLFESNGTADHAKQYNCRGEVATKELKGNKVVFKEVEVQVGSSEHGNDLTSCPADEDVNDMIPIAVGAALLALVAIVLVAYFVGRRRSRRLAYQSV